MAVAAAVVAVFACGDTAPSRAATPSLLAQVNAVRGSLGLAPLRDDLLARQVVSRMAKTDRYDRAPDVLDAQPACEVCERFFEGGGSVDPRELYQSLGGRAAIRFAPLARQVERHPEPLGLLPGGRARARPPRAHVLGCPDAAGMLVVGVTGDATARFDRAVRWPRGSLDPRQQLWVQVVLPPGYGYPNLYDVREGREVTVAYPLAVGQGIPRCSARRLRPQHVTRLRPRVPRRRSRFGVRLKTRSTPAAFLRRSWTFHSVNRAGA